MREASALARGVLIWLVPFAIVAAVLGFETDWGRDVDGQTAQTASPAVQPVSVALLPEYRVDGGVDARKETVDRVLFNPTRRPAPPAAATAASATMKKGQYTLTGTTMVGRVATAFLKEVNGGKSRSVRKGETFDGMLVAEVAQDHVRLKQGDEFEDLALKVAGGPRTTVQIAQPAAPVAGQPAGQPVAQPNAPGAPPGAGGTGGVRPQTRPVAPPAAPGATTPRAGGGTSVSEVLAERRRAARAAAEAAAAGRSPSPGQQ